MRLPGRLPERQQRGFSLVELLFTVFIVGLLASLGVRAWQQSQLRVARLDAVEAITRIQMAQEQYRALHGLYTSELGLLKGAAARSRQGHYQLALQQDGADGYTVVATAQGPQAHDRGCPALTLAVRDSLPEAGPSAGCWNR